MLKINVQIKAEGSNTGGQARAVSTTMDGNLTWPITNWHDAIAMPWVINN